MALCRYHIVGCTHRRLYSCAQVVPPSFQKMPTRPISLRMRTQGLAEAFSPQTGDAAKYGRLRSFHSFERISVRSAYFSTARGGKGRRKTGEEPERHGGFYNAPGGARFSAVGGRVSGPYCVHHKDTACGCQYGHLQNQAPVCEFLCHLYPPLKNTTTTTLCVFLDPVP